ncbi:hypothetical protein CYK23_03150 [Streptococcus salivarius]|nr:hypothetical protein CYK23_03150 [Streptococcus salivarius]
MGVLTENWIKRTCCAVWFPYPIKVTGVSYTLENFQADSRSVFPSPPEVNGSSYLKITCLVKRACQFPSPLEETGVSYTSVKYPRDAVREFPSPSEVTGGLTEAEFKAMLIEYAFPSPLKVTGGSYRMRSLVSNNKLVSVPYRGNWGVLHMLLQLTKY